MELMADLRPALEALCAGDAGFRSTLDSGVNTDPDWEEQIRTALESGTKLSQDFNALKLTQQQDELDFSKSRSEVQKRRDQAIKQHQGLLDKLESVRVKLQLNNSKATRKNFLSKIQEVTSEKSRAQEERDKLGEELAEAEAKLAALQLEQEDERRQWEQDLSDLRRQTEHAQKEAKEAEAKAQRDMRTALERHRDTSEQMVQAWLNQVSGYLSGLRAELPHRFRQERAQWDRRETAVKRSQSELQTRISHLLQQLDRHELESLPPIHLPALPQVPMAELYFQRIMQVVPRPPAPPPVLPPPPVMAPPPVVVNPRPALLPNPMGHAHFPLQQPFPRQHYPPPIILTHPCLPVTSLPVHTPPPQIQTPPPQIHTPPPQMQTPPPPQQAPPTINTAAKPVDHAPFNAPAAPAAPAGAPAAPAVAAGKLDKVLEKLGAQFPRCSRAQLTRFLQQVKSERGTLAGLSMEEVVEQIRHKVEASSANPRPAAPSAPTAPAPGSRKPCLVCQKPVDAGSKFELQCSHTVHTECIQMWLQSSKSNSCPFCPNK